jgi:sporulation protein YlmC with PRC-barrel domain
VIDAQVARQAGVVSEVEMDLASGRLAAVMIRHSDGWSTQRVPAAFVYRIERGTVLVQDSVELNFRPPMAADERWITSARIAGLPVLSDQGDRVGRLLDLDLDGDTLGVKTYLLDKRRWLLLRRKIQQADVVSVSHEMMIVRG